MRAFAISATKGIEESVQRLFLSDKGLKQVPEQVRLMKNLEVLDLSHNALEELPLWLQELTRLNQLVLSYNPLLSPNVDFVLPVSLEHLEIRGMGWEGFPSTIFDLPLLKSLNAGQNKIKALTEEIGKLEVLERLVLDTNTLRAIPTSFRKLNELRILSLQGNQIRKLSIGLTKCGQLTELHLDENQLTALPKGIGRLGKLELLSAPNNRLRRIPSELANCSMLRKLQLSGNRLKQLPSTLSNLDWLTEVDVSDNKLAQGPAVLAQCQRLRKLSLAGNRMKRLGEWPDTLQLEEVDLSKNLLANIEALKGLPQLRSLNIAANKLADFPDGFWAFPKLQTLEAERLSAKLSGEQLLPCPQLCTLKGLLTTAKRTQLLQFLSLARAANWNLEERSLFYPLYQKNKEAWQRLTLEAAWKGGKVPDPYFAMAFRHFLYKQSARRTQIKQGAKLWIVGELEERMDTLAQRLSRFGISISQEGIENSTHVILGTAKLPPTIPSLSLPWYSESLLMQHLDRLAGKKWSRQIPEEQITHLRKLLLHEEEVNAHLALQLMNGSGLPKELMTDLLGLFFKEPFPDLQEKIQALLFPYLPDSLKLILHHGPERPSAKADPKLWKKWLATKEINVQRLLSVLR